MCSHEEKDGFSPRKELICFSVLLLFTYVGIKWALITRVVFAITTNTNTVIFLLSFSKHFKHCSNILLWYCLITCWLQCWLYCLPFSSPRATVVAVATFLDAFQKVADLATNSRGRNTLKCGVSWWLSGGLWRRRRLSNLRPSVWHSHTPCLRLHFLYFWARDHLTQDTEIPHNLVFIAIWISIWTWKINLKLKMLFILDIEKVMSYAAVQNEHIALLSWLFQ